MSNWKWVSNSPQDEMAYWRSTRQHGTLILILILIAVFSVTGFAPGVVLATAVSIGSGVASFRLLIDGNPRIRTIARLGNMRRGALVVLFALFAMIIVLQVILAAEFGAWQAGCVSLLALVTEWLIARELCGARPVDGLGEG